VNRRLQKKQTGMGNQQPLIYKWSVWALICTVLVLGIWIGVLLEDRENTTHAHESSYFEDRGKTSQVYENSFSSFSAATMQIAGLFSCSCGSCGEKNLAICECPTALSTKRFITDKLKSGSPQDQVIDLVKTTYGHFTG